MVTTTESYDKGTGIKRRPIRARGLADYKSPNEEKVFISKVLILAGYGMNLITGHEVLLPCPVNSALTAWSLWRFGVAMTISFSPRISRTRGSEQLMGCTSVYRLRPAADSQTRHITKACKDLPISGVAVKGNLVARYERKESFVL